MNYPKLKITFLGSGTSSGVPMIGCNCVVCKSSNKRDKRLRISILVESQNTTLVVDTTPDFRYQMLRQNVSKLDAILYTHSHKDHIAGLDDIRAYNYLLQKPMDIYASDITQKALKKEFSYAFEDEKFPGLPQLHMHTIPEDEFLIGDIPVIPINVHHLRMPVLGFRFGAFTYITDANRIDEIEKEKIKGSKVFTLNALRMEKHVSHFSLPEAVELVNELGIEQAYFTHISHQLGLHNDVNNMLPMGIELAWDGLEINL